ncbi:hypothetical protein PS9374_07120 [Planomonospora sphaerica]|uniref:Uncharacterized protein n=1 Tax=Planomonospora sphaerica TaxID=161355 RepID=A0A161LZC3_9ACTN|nr:hypothetical protein PS9374_07120 [Planomonospora sphaerica]
MGFRRPSIQGEAGAPMCGAPGPARSATGGDRIGKVAERGLDPLCHLVVYCVKAVAVMTRG